MVRELLPAYRTLWVNTLGMRRPQMSLADVRKAAAKLRTIAAGGSSGHSNETLENLQVLAPAMWPGFRNRLQRRFNAHRIAAAVTRALHHMDACQTSARPYTVALTTLPITADLVGRLPVDRWVYYAVDDFSTWPGVDQQVMAEMEAQLVRKVDAIAAVSQVLCQRMRAMGRADVTLVTHGVSQAFFHCNNDADDEISSDALFWGLIDERLDLDWCRALGEALVKRGGRLRLVGESRLPAEALRLPGVVWEGPAAFADLPKLAASVGVLVMPYRDLPVTRAMQPLKFKEYLATARPVVSRALPATQTWCDAADLATKADAFAALVLQRMSTGLPEAQRRARDRLQDETWAGKAAQLEAMWQCRTPALKPAR